MTSHFQQGSGCFACVVCGRKTRQTGAQCGSTEMCPECDEASMCENGISDCGDADGSLQARINELNQAAVNKGGKIDGYTRIGGAK